MKPHHARTSLFCSLNKDRIIISHWHEISRIGRLVKSMKFATIFGWWFPPFAILLPQYLIQVDDRALIFYSYVAQTPTPTSHVFPWGLNPLNQTHDWSKIPSIFILSDQPAEQSPQNMWWIVNKEVPNYPPKGHLFQVFLGGGFHPYLFWLICFQLGRNHQLVRYYGKICPDLHLPHSPAWYGFSPAAFGSENFWSSPFVFPVRKGYASIASDIQWMDKTSWTWRLGL